MSKIRPFSIRNQLGDTQITKISQKCREKLRFLNYFWFQQFWDKTYVTWYIFYTDGVYMRVLKSSANLWIFYNGIVSNSSALIKVYFIFKNYINCGFLLFENIRLAMYLCFVKNDFQNPKNVPKNFQFLLSLKLIFPTNSVENGSECMKGLNLGVFSQVEFTICLRSFDKELHRWRFHLTFYLTKNFP